MKKVYRADVREMLNVAKDLEEFCDSEALPQDIAFALNLCVDEMFTNVASYAYDGDKDGKVELEVLIQDGFLKTYIRESGKPFNPLCEAKAPDLDAPLQERDIGGLGVYLLKKNMDELSYKRIGETNELMFAKKLPQHA